MLEVDPVLPQRPSPGDMTLNRTPTALITWLLADKVRVTDQRSWPHILPPSRLGNTRTGPGIAPTPK